MDMWGAVREVITMYGPLALGYPIAWMLWRDNQRKDELLLNLTEKALTTMSALTQVVNALKDELGRTRNRT